MFALSQSFGRVSQSTDFWKMFLKQGASSSAHVLRMMFGILSGPMALDGLVFFSNFSTPSTVIFRFCIVEPKNQWTAVLYQMIGSVQTLFQYLKKVMSMQRKIIDQYL
jgi:hypothetical protein